MRMDKESLNSWMVGFIMANGMVTAVMVLVLWQKLMGLNTEDSGTLTFSKVLRKQLKALSKLYTRVSITNTGSKGLGDYNGWRIIASMQESGTRMFSKELENTNGFQMAKLILDLMKITRCLVLESRHGQMEGNILDFML